MREYGQIQCAFWQSPDAQDFTDTGKLLAAYLMTGPHSNGIGCYRLSDGYIGDDLGWSAEKVSKGFEELSAKGFAYRFERVVLLPGFLRWNRVSNANVAKARFAEFEALPKGEAKTRAARALLEFGAHWDDEARKGFERVCQTSSKQNPTQPLPKPLPEPKQVAPPSEPATPAEKAVIELPLAGGKEFPVTQAQVREFSDLYPAVDVVQELRSMRGWCVSNPTNRKTKNGILRFVNRWLSKAQDGARTGGAQPRTAGKDQNYIPMPGEF